MGSTPEVKVNATAQNAGFLLKELRQKKTSRYLSYAPPAYEYGTRPFLRWVLSQGRSPTRQAVPKIPRTPSAFSFSGRLRRQAINPTPPKRVKAWGDGPLRPEVMYPVVEHTRTDCAARNHSRSRAPHHRTQSIAKKKTSPLFVAASHQTRLDTRSKARRPIKVGIKGRGGREQAETRTLLVNAAQPEGSLLLFVAASHQTRLDTRSKARRPIKVGIKGRGRSGTSRDSNPACLCCSSAHLVQCEPDEASSFTNPNVGPGTYASLRLKLDAWSSAVQGGQRRQKCSSPTRR